MLKFNTNRNLFIKIIKIFVGWGYWSICSETCEKGIRRRIRKCYGNGACYGNEYQREDCKLKECKIFS